MSLDPTPHDVRGSTGTWMLYGAAGHTGGLMARHALARGHRPLLAGRNGLAIAALAEPLGLPHRTLSLDDPDALSAGLHEVQLLLNAAGPFVHTAQPLAEACLDAGVHYLDISNELQVFRRLYDLDTRARRAAVAVIPGVGFGVMATNGLARYVSDAVGGARDLALATRIASADPGPGATATLRENLPFGGWIRQDGQLVPRELFAGPTTVDFPDGRAHAVPVPTGDLEAAFRATGAPNIVSYAAQPLDQPADGVAATASRRSFAWARATGVDGAVAEAVLETGDSYAFTAAASILAVEETLARLPHGALSPTEAFGPDLVLEIEGTTRTPVDGPILGRVPLGNT